MKQSLVGLVVALFAFYSHGMGGRPLDIPEGAESHFVTAPDGVKIHYLTMGEGTPVFLIHGYYADAKVNWWSNGIAQELAQTHKVIAIDQRGHGYSDKPRVRSAYGGKMWRDAIMVLDDQNVEKAHIHGYSMGGTILTQILHHHPERVISATYGGAGVREFDPEQQQNIPPDLQATPEIEAIEKEAEEKLLEETEPDHVALYILSQNGPGVDGEERAIDLPSLNIPVLAVNGDYDHPNIRTFRMTRELRNFRSVVLPNKGHLSAITPGFMPPEYLNETVNFIRNN